MAQSRPNLLTPAAYARHRKSAGLPGGSREAVSKAIEQGRISLIGDKVDQAVADIQWEQNTRARQSPQAAAAAAPAGAPAPDLVTQAAAAAPGEPPAAAPVATVPDGYTAARARRELADAETAEIQLKKLRGEVLVAADVARAGYEVGRELRDAMESAVNSQAAELAALLTADSCAEVLRRQNRAMQDLLVKCFREKIGLVPPAGVA